MIVHVLQMMARNLIIFLHHLVLVVALYPFMPWALSWDMLLVLPGLAILLVTLFGAATVLGMLCARYRDIGSAIISGLQFIFFLTPIIWTPDALHGTAFHWLIQANSFATLLDLVRKPMLSQPTDPTQWLLGSTYAAALAIVGLNCYAKYRHRVAYWL